ncbi:MAG: hypothetical protein IKI37_03035 [Oscillospiraceae bacterium]|nr:hypothetical protein [Oscillospiraceae bacterium]
MEKIAYLKGIMEGLGVHPESREGKLFGAVCEALQEYFPKPLANPSLNCPK